MFVVGGRFAVPFARSFVTAMALLLDEADARLTMGDMA
jgi:hypothetical protein